MNVNEWRRAMWGTFKECRESEFVNCQFRAQGDCLKHRPRPAQTAPKEREQAA